MRGRADEAVEDGAGDLLHTSGASPWQLGVVAVVCLAAGALVSEVVHSRFDLSAGRAMDQGSTDSKLLDRSSLARLEARLAAIEKQATPAGLIQPPAQLGSPPATTAAAPATTLRAATAAPTTAAHTTAAPTTASPTTGAPTTSAPTTDAPTTGAPTAAPTLVQPGKIAPAPPARAKASWPPFAFRDLEESILCPTARSDQNTLRCLVPSSDGRTATIHTMSQADFMHANGYDPAVIQEPSNTIGRFFNKLVTIKWTLVGAAECNGLIKLPNVITKSPEGNAPAFNCADFRNLAYPNHTHIRIESRGRSYCSKLRATKGTAWWYMKYFEARKKHSGGRGNNDLFREAVANRAVASYWGLRDRYFRCKPCSAPNLYKVAVYFRSGDVFRDKQPHWKYGQPPLHFYVQSTLQALRHPDAIGQLKEVIILAEDLKNPVIKKVQEFNFGDDVVLSTEIAQPFVTVLNHMFCANAIVLGSSTMNIIADLSPTAREVYQPRNGMDEKTGFGIFSPLVQKEGGNADKYRFADYVYTNTSDYSPYTVWRNTPEQHQQLISFKSGKLVGPGLFAVKNFASQHL